MSLRDVHARYDGFSALTMGVDSGRSPFLLPRDQLSWLVNGTMRGGFVGPRPGIRNRALSFLNQNFAEDTTVSTNFKTAGRYQGAHSYIDDNGKGSIIASVGGRLFQIDIQSFEVQDLTAQAGFTNQSDAPQSWFCQAENFLLHQNASDKMTIYDGATVRQANPYTLGGDELPGGSVMAYNNGRVWLANDTGTAFVAGDQVYSNGSRDSVLKITENQFLTGGGAFTNRGAFASPTGIGPIRAMTSLAVQDSTTGQGVLQVFGTAGAFSINSGMTREQWQTAVNPVQTVSLIGNGSVSQNATVLVNGDAWFRSLAGVQSFVVAQRDHGTWVNTPLSREVERALTYDTPELLRYGSAVLFDNRLLMTVRPEMANNDSTVRGVVHKGLVVLDFAPVSQMFNRSQPVWDGLWTGLDILQILTVETPNRKRCFIFALNDDSEIELWELTASDRFDSLDNRIEWAFETPAYGFDTGGWNMRRIAYGDLWLNRVAGTVDVTVEYRCDSDPIWRDWKSFQVCSTTSENTCDLNDCLTCQLEQYRTRVRLPTPTPVEDESAGKPTDLGYRFAARVEVTGHCVIPQFRLVARDEPEDAVGASPETTCTLSGVEGTPVDDYSYEIEL